MKPFPKGRLDELLRTDDGLLTSRFPHYSRGELREIKARYRDEKKEQEDKDSYQHVSKERDYEFLKKRNSFWETIGNTFTEAVRSLPDLPPPPHLKPPPLGEMKMESAVLVISDVQAGSVVSSEGTGGLGNFNSSILARRITKLFTDVGSVANTYHRNVRTLYIFLLGDIIDGSTIFEGQLRQIDTTTVKQVTYCAETFASHINDLSQQFDQIRIFTICGNHGRIGKKGVNDPLDNLDYLVYYMLKMRLERNPKVYLELPDSWFKVVEIMGWNFLLAHGDDILSWLGIPWYGLQRSKWKMQELLQPERVDYYVVGDKHTAGDVIASNLIMNGCWPGGSEFSLKNLQVGGAPVQLFFGVDTTYGKTWTRAMYLEKPIRKSRIRVAR